MTQYIEDFVPVVKYSGLNTAKAVDFSGAASMALPSGATSTSQVLTTPVVTGGLTASGSGANDFSASTGTFKTSSGAVTISGAATMAAGKSLTIGTGGFVGTGTTPTSWSTGGAPARSGSEGTDTTPATTETYICEIFIPVNTTLTGLSVLNGSAVSGNINVGLASSTGAVVASSATTTAGSGTNAFQQIPFSTTYAAVGPAKYYALVQYSATTARYRTYPVGNFGASAKTSETYGTFTTVTPPTTFATAGAVIASTY